MTAPPLFTIFIPTIGRLTYLREAIASAQAQTYPNVEILVGDEMSQDGTQEFIQELSRADPRFRFYRSETRLGMPGNWQRGLDEAHGEFITIVSDDDILMPEFADRCVAAFAQNNSLDVVSTLHQVIDENGHPDAKITKDREAFFRNQLLNKPACNLVTFPPMMSSTFRLHWARQIGFWVEATLAADVDFFRRAGAKGYQCHLITEHLVQYRMHGGSMSSARAVDQGRGNLNSILRIEREHPESTSTPEWQALRTKSIYSLIHCLTKLGHGKEAGQLLFRHGGWLPVPTRLKCAARIIASPLLSHGS